MKYYASWWDDSVLMQPFDFAVLGSGLIGKQIAIKLKKNHPKARVAMIDRMPISYGASTRNAGFACFGSITEIVDDLSQTPEQQVFETLHKRFIGIQQLVREFGQAAIGYEATGSYELFQSASAFDFAQDHIDVINQKVAEYTAAKQVFKIQSTTNLNTGFYAKGIYNPYEGAINSGLLNQVISEQSLALGVLPMFGFNVESIQPISNGYELIADSGLILKSKQLIIANNAFAKSFLPDQDIQPARGQIILTKPLKQLSLNGIFHVDQGYYYFRHVGDRLLLGGGRQHFKSEENTFDFEGSESVKNHLIDWMQEWILPKQSFEIETHWSGIMAMGQHKLPIVERVNEHLTCCVRMSGMGVALGPVLSDQVLSWFE